MTADEIRALEAEVAECAHVSIAGKPVAPGLRAFGQPRLVGVYPNTVLIVPVSIRDVPEFLDWEIWTQPGDGREPYCGAGDLMMNISVGIEEVP